MGCERYAARLCRTDETATNETASNTSWPGTHAARRCTSPCRRCGASRCWRSRRRASPEAWLPRAGLIEFDVLGVCATLAAAIGAWLEMGQHESLARAYAIAAHELAAIRDLVPWQETEEDWAQFVGSAEEAVSREHTMWRASRAPDRSAG